MDIWIPPKPAIIVPGRHVERPVGFKPVYLPGLASPFAPQSGPSISSSFVSANASATGATSTTFTAQALGAASATRRILLGITTTSVGNVYSSSSVQGIACATHLNVKDGTSGKQVIFASAQVPTGTTGDVILTFNASVSHCAFGAWAIINEAGSAANATANSLAIAGAVISTTINIPSIPNCLFGVCIGSSTGTAPTYTWIGVTEDFDAVESGLTSHSGGHTDGLAVQTGRTVSATLTPATGPPTAAIGALVWV